MMKFDFLGERVIEGITTKGTTLPAFNNKASWVEAYKIAYSPDAIHWNPIMNEDKSEKVYLTNFKSVIFNFDVNIKY